MYIDVIINDKVETLNLYSLPDYNEDRSIAYIYNGFFNLGEDKICYLIYEVPIYVDGLNITHYDWENKKSHKLEVIKRYFCKDNSHEEMLVYMNSNNYSIFEDEELDLMREFIQSDPDILKKFLSQYTNYYKSNIKRNGWE